MINPLHILIGQFNNLTGRNRTLRDFRIELGCKQCAIAHKDHQYIGWCQSSEGGCNCNGNAKASLNLKSSRCPQHVWANRWIKTDSLIKINKERNFTPRREIEPNVIIQLNEQNQVEHVKQ